MKKNSQFVYKFLVRPNWLLTQARRGVDIRDLMEYHYWCLTDKEAKNIFHMIHVNQLSTEKLHLIDTEFKVVSDPNDYHARYLI